MKRTQVERPAPRDLFTTTVDDLVVPRMARQHEGLRVAHLTDFHVGPGTPSGRLRGAVDWVNGQKPDLVFLTGDFVTRSSRPIPRIREQLGGLEAPTFVTLGNHDHWVGAGAIRRELENVGYTVLQNSHAALSLYGAPVIVLGVDDGRTRHDDVEGTLRGAPTAATRFVLTHVPTTITKLPPDEGLICFAGHTHGGQIFMRRVTEALMHLAGQPFVRGVHEVQGNVLYVNRGLGFGRGSAMPRWGSPPEVALFTLSRRPRATPR